MRFEPPASSRRWENPTFEIEENDEVPLAEITSHISATFSNHISMATQHVILSSSHCFSEGAGVCNLINFLISVTTAQIKDFIVGTSACLLNFISYRDL